jgi:hypothetical protein
VGTPKFTVINGGAQRAASTAKIALSLVHPSGRIDVPADAIHWIETSGEFLVSVRGRLQAWPSPHVELSLRPDIGIRIYRLTRNIVGDVVDLVVDGQSVSKIRVITPVGLRSRIRIDVLDLAKAEALAARLRARCGKTELRAIV